MKKIYIQYIQDLSIAFAKYHYHIHLKKHNLEYIKYENVNSIVDEVYSKEMQKQLFAFIREKMRDNMKEQYNPMLIEPLLLEIAENPQMAMARIIVEIHEHQKIFYKVNDINVQCE